MENLKEKDLDLLCDELSRNPANLHTLTEIAETAVATIASDNSGVVRLPSEASIVEAVSIGGYIPVFEIDAPEKPTDLCKQPIQSSTSIHIGPYGFSFGITYTYWCPTWTKPWRTCKGTITIAGFSFEANVDIGYTIDCKGMTAWGSAYAQTCVTILFVKYCSSCSAEVTGVAQAQSSSVSGMCTYGYGLTMSVRCVYAGITVFSLTIPLGLRITAPCPT